MYLSWDLIVLLNLHAIWTLSSTLLFVVDTFKAPKASRVHGGKSSKSPGSGPQQLTGSQWDNIIKFLDSLMIQLRANHVCHT